MIGTGPMSTPFAPSIQKHLSAGNWRRRYQQRIRLIDAGVIIWAVVGAYGVRFGFTDLTDGRSRDFDYVVLSIGLVVAWWIMLELWGSREAKVFGAGADEYERVISASAWLFGFVAVLSYALRIDTARGYVGLAFPAGALGLLAARWLIRQHLSMERKRGTSNNSGTNRWWSPFSTTPCPISGRRPGRRVPPRCCPFAGREPGVPVLQASNRARDWSTRRC